MVYDSNGSVSLEAIFQSGNLYGYCMGNPVRWVDPSGELVWSYSTGINITLGSGVSTSIGWVCDSYGNEGLMITYSFFMVNDTVHLGLCDVGFSGQITILDAIK